MRQFWNITSGIYTKYHAIICLYYYPPWVRTLFLKSPEMEFFSPTYNVARLSALRDIFSVQDIFSPGISLQEYFLSQISVQDICFWNHLYPPLQPPLQKSNVWPLGKSSLLGTSRMTCCKHNLTAYWQLASKFSQWELPVARLKRVIQLKFMPKRPSVFLASLPSLALCFQPRSRPFVWLLSHTWICKNTDCFAVSSTRLKLN